MSRSLVLAFLLSFLGAIAQAQRDPEAEAAIAKQLAEIAPDAVASFQKATAAMDAGDRASAEAAFREALALAPDFPPALRRLSYVIEDRNQSLELARRAYALERHPYNLSAIVQSLLRFEDPVKVREVGDLAWRLFEERPEDADSLALVATAASRQGNETLFRRAAGALRRVAPDEVPTHYFTAVEAASDGDWQRAEREIERAKALGFPEEEAEAFLEGTGIRSRARAWQYARYAGYAWIAWALGLAVLTAAGVVLSRKTLKAIDQEPPSATGVPGGSIGTIRRLYAIVLALTSFYFYLSMPFVFVMVVGLAGGFIYGLLTAGYIPIKLLVLAGILLFVTLWAMLKGLFARGDSADPGERLEEQSAPELYAVLREVAAKVGTPMVDSVFLVADATVAVFERGSTLKHLRHRGERCLVLGLGALNGLKLGPFKGVLAHEYGHLSNRDTAGGSLALQVRRSILTSAVTLAQGGAAVWYNPAWWFLNGFYRLYLRISQGASRLQEVLADRWAVLAYGRAAFASGLQHVVRRGIEFDFVSNQEMATALRESRPLRNLYHLKVPALEAKSVDEAEDEKSPAERIEEAYQSALNAPASPYDSHPSPVQRIAWVERLTNAPDSGPDGAEVWSLFPEKEKLQELITRKVGDRLRAYVAQQEIREAETEQLRPEDEVTTLGLGSGKR
jgi:Zn-dependent protease with chaperone function